MITTSGIGCGFGFAPLVQIPSLLTEGVHDTFVTTSENVTTAIQDLSIRTQNYFLLNLPHATEFLYNFGAHAIFAGIFHLIDARLPFLLIASSLRVEDKQAYESNLWRDIALELGINRGLAIDVGAGANNLAARGMREAGIEKVVLLDIESYNNDGAEETMGIFAKIGDATELPFGDSEAVAVFFNFSLFYLLSPSLRTKTVRDAVLHELKKGQSQIKYLVDNEERLGRLAVKRAFEEAFRVLMPGGFLLIRTNNLADKQWSVEEIKIMLSEAGFKDVQEKLYGTEKLKYQDPDGSVVDLFADQPLFIYVQKPAKS